MTVLCAVPLRIRPQYATGVMTPTATVRIGNQSAHAMVPPRSCIVRSGHRSLISYAPRTSPLLQRAEGGSVYDPACSPDQWRHTPQLIVTNADGAWTRGEAGSLRDRTLCAGGRIADGRSSP